jgi:SAM-dependent methyltransferase
VTANEEMARYWNEEGGTSWVAEQARFDAQLAPFAEVVLRSAVPQPGERAIDVGCGIGALTVEVGRAVTPDGAVLGVDVSTPMVELARLQAEEAGVPVQYLIADAQTVDLADDGPFDLLVSRFGVMFFDDPVAAFANLHGTLTPEGRLAFACWQGFSTNPWMSVPMLAALEHLPPPPLLAPDAPGPWAFADPGRVRSVLTDAGFVDVELDPFEGELALAGGGDASSVFEFLRATSLGRALLQQEDPALAERVKASVLEALEEHEDDGEVRLGFSSWIVTARRGS